MSDSQLLSSVSAQCRIRSQCQLSVRFGVTELSVSSVSDSQSVSQCQLSVRFAVTELSDADSVAVSRVGSISVGRVAPSLTSEPVHVSSISREDVVVFTEDQ